MEVRPERAGGNRFLEVRVARRDQPDVDLDRLGAAQTLELSLLQDAEQLDLRRRVEVTDLIQKQGAAVGQLKAPFLAAFGASERPLLVAEQLGLDQRVGNAAQLTLTNGFFARGEL